MAALIGPKGGTIRQVAMDTGARLVVLPLDVSAIPPSEDEVLEIVGLPGQVGQSQSVDSPLTAAASLFKSCYRTKVPTSTAELE